MSKKNNGLGKFLAGAAIGAGLGILFAPKKGSETREELKKNIDSLISKAKDLDKEEIKAELESKLYEIRDMIDNLDKETVMAVAKKQVRKIQEMTNELVSYTKEVGTPALEEAATKVKDACIETANNIVEKLEKKGSKK